MRIFHSVLILISLIGMAAPVQANPKGKAVYDKVCGNCHNTGVANSPKLSDNADWAPRLRKAGVDGLYQSALNGTPLGMPRKGGATDLSDAEVKAAVDYMVSKLPAKVVSVASTPITKPAPAAPAATTQTAAPPPPAPVAAAPATVNTFNRLLKPAGARNAPPAEDGIHDPENEGTHALQHPLQAYAGMPKSNAGNRVSWVAALAEKKITPRWDRVDLTAEAIVMDLDIVREVKGTMPNVLYPHKPHTEILDCSNCHPAIFEPQKGSNKLSMAAIMMGQQCGVCHGKVAFPISECRICHSQKKTAATTTADKP